MAVILPPLNLSSETVTFQSIAPSQLPAEEKCAVCYDEYRDPVGHKVGQVFHAFCRSCVEQWEDTGRSRECFLCKRNFRWKNEEEPPFNFQPPPHHFFLDNELRPPFRNFDPPRTFVQKVGAIWNKLNRRETFFETTALLVALVATAAFAVFGLYIGCEVITSTYAALQVGPHNPYAEDMMSRAILVAMAMALVWSVPLYCVLLTLDDHARTR